MNPYIPNDGAVEKDLLEKVGYKKIEDLIETQIPRNIIEKSKLKDIPGLSEIEVREKLHDLADKNFSKQKYNFCGGGFYPHYIPSAVDYLSSRSEFLTSYTPYQPEISQGTLQAVFEYQTMTSRLMGMEISNASMYDCATAFTEAVLLAKRQNPSKNIVFVSKAIHPEYKETLKTYLKEMHIEIAEIPIDPKTGKLNVSDVESAISSANQPGKAGALCLGLQSPNFFGVIEDQKEIFEITSKNNVISISAISETTSLGLLKSPGELGADIAVGEGQSLGNYSNMGGPGVGIFTTKQNLIRQIPGRLVGKTQDTNGNVAYTLTLSTREQHIRREKATSNICSNQGVCALRTGMYLAITGEHGLRQVATYSHSNAVKLFNKLTTLSGVTAVYSGLFYNEFILRVENLDARFEKALKEGVIPGIKLSKFTEYKHDKNLLLVAATEIHSDEAIEKLARSLA